MAYTTIDDPSEFFHTRLYSGNNSGSGLAITNNANAGDFQPDWVWVKRRDSAGSSGLHDSSRGSTKRLKSDANEGEDTNSNILASFNSNGFTIGDNSGNYNASGTYVAWQWKANGGTTTTNDASSTSVGTIDSVYQANTTAGFSIVTYTGTGSEGTIAHGLGVTPKMIIWKRRTDNGNNWSVQGKQSGINTDRVEINLNSNGAKSSVDSRIGRQSQWSSTVFEVNTYVDQNASSKDYVAYCFAEKQGYSKFGSYIGNYNANGPFAYTGFKPAFVIAKRASGSGDWRITDNKRDPFNIVGGRIKANTTAAEDNNDQFDYLSNGFKVRADAGDINSDGDTHIYLAFAEHPFVSSTGTPTTAR